MAEKCSELINRYIYDVTRRLPSGQREDVGRELQSLIEDMLEERGGEDDLAAVKAVLMELGEPRLLANKYRDSKRWLIGPEFIDAYYLVLKIVMPCVAFGVTLGMLMGKLTPSGSWDAGGIGAFIWVIFVGVFNGALQGFAYVTLIFAICERLGATEAIIVKEPWTTEKLQPIPIKKEMIGRVEPIVSIVFSAIVMALYHFAPQLLGAISVSNGTREEWVFVSVFHLPVFNSMIWLFDLCILLSIAKEVFRLMEGRHTPRLAVTTAILNAVGIVLTLVIFVPGTVWNPDFVQQVTGFWPEAGNGIQTAWSIFRPLLPAIVIFAYLLETGETLYKGFSSSLRRQLRLDR